jgi:hypothetical protein
MADRDNLFGKAFPACHPQSHSGSHPVEESSHARLARAAALLFLSLC